MWWIRLWLIGSVVQSLVCAQKITEKPLRNNGCPTVCPDLKILQLGLKGGKHSAVEKPFVVTERTNNIQEAIIIITAQGNKFFFKSLQIKFPPGKLESVSINLDQREELISEHSFKNNNSILFEVDLDEDLLVADKITKVFIVLHRKDFKVASYFELTLQACFAENIEISDFDEVVPPVEDFREGNCPGDCIEKTLVLNDKETIAVRENFEVTYTSMRSGLRVCISKTGFRGRDALFLVRLLEISVDESKVKPVQVTYQHSGRPDRTAIAHRKEEGVYQSSNLREPKDIKKVQIDFIFKEPTDNPFNTIKFFACFNQRDVDGKGTSNTTGKCPERFCKNCSQCVARGKKRLQQCEKLSCPQNMCCCLKPRKFRKMCR